MPPTRKAITNPTALGHQGVRRALGVGLRVLQHSLPLPPPPPVSHPISPGRQIPLKDCSEALHHQKCRECSRAILGPFAARAYLRGSVALWYLFPGHDLSKGLGTFAGVCLPRRPGPGQLWARSFPVQVSVLQV